MVLTLEFESGRNIQFVHQLCYLTNTCHILFIRLGLFVINAPANLVLLVATPGSFPSSARASPAPQGLPNGKPPVPYQERSNSEGPQSQLAAQTVSSKDPKVAAQQASDMKNIVRRKLTGYVGFANLPNQWHRKSVRKGFNFNVMVVGKDKNHENLTAILDLTRY